MANNQIKTMDKILLNLANLDALAFCKANNIDCSNSRIYKYPRRWTYALINNETGRAIVTLTFSRNAVTTHLIHD